MLLFFHAGVVREEACWVYSDTYAVRGGLLSFASLFIVDDNGLIVKNASPYVPSATFLHSADLEYLTGIAHTMLSPTLHKLVSTYTTRHSANPVDLSNVIADSFLTDAFQSGLRNTLPKGM